MGLEGKIVDHPSALSLFSGCGGFCDGMELAGWKVTCAVELDRFAAETYRFNFPDVALWEGDVRQFLNAAREDNVKKYGLGNVDLVFGGPPCQGYSQIGTRDLGDERNSLYEQFARIVDQLRPKIFLMENVPNLLLLRKGCFRDLILEKFRSIGYANATFIRASAADFGVPQLRRRVFFLGTRDESRFPFDLKNYVEAAMAGLKLARPFTVREAISDLPAQVVPSGETMPYPGAAGVSRFQKMMRLDFDAAPYSKRVKRARGMGTRPVRLYNHHTKEIQERRKHLISLLKPGQKADSLPKEVWNGLRPEKWRRLDPDVPSYTILAQMHRDLSEWVHPQFERWITVREAARLQSFHDGFIFAGSEWQQLKQIGNAVPPLLAYCVGRAIRALIPFMVSVLAACSAMPPAPVVDPTLNWTAPTTDCAGNPLSAVTYNVYVVPGPGPVPTTSTGAGELPCGAVEVADRSRVQPRNAEPVTATSYQLVVADGLYTAAIEAVNAVGNPSALSNQKTFAVVGRPAPASGVEVGP